MKKNLLILLLLSLVPLARLAAQAPTLRTPTFVSSTGFQGRWTDNGGFGSYFIDVSLSPSFANFVEPYSDLNITQMYTGSGITVANLAANTTYYWRLRAVNFADESSVSATQQVKTKPHAQALAPVEFLNTFEGPGITAYLDIAADEDGNIYAVGAFESTVTIGVTTLTSSSGYGMFLSKFDASGVPQWTVKLVGDVDLEEEEILLEYFADNVYVFASVAQQVDIDPGAPVQNIESGPFFAKYDASDGAFVWAKAIEGDIQPRALQVNSAGVFVAGTFQACDFDPGVGTVIRTAPGDDDEGYVASYSLDGIYQWVGVVTGQGEDEINDLLVDGSDVYYAGDGDYAETVDIDPTAGTIFAPENSTFLGKLNAVTGALVWARSFHVSNDWEFGYINEPMLGNLGTTLLMAVSANASIDFGGNFEVETIHAEQLLLVEYSKSIGNAVRVRALESGGQSEFYLSRIQSFGNTVYIGGGMAGSVDFNWPIGGGEINAESVIEGVDYNYSTGGASFVAAYDYGSGSFEYKWVKAFKNNGDDEHITGAFVANANGLYGAGYFDGTNDFDPYEGEFATGDAEGDAFIVKYDLGVVPPNQLVAPVATAATDIFGTGFTAHWNPVVGAAYYKVDVGQDEAGTFYFAEGTDGELDGIVVQSATQLVVTGLQPLSDYQYRVRAISAYGGSLNSNLIDVTTGAAGPPPPNNFVTSLVSNTGFIVKFDAMPDATGYELELSNDNFATIMNNYSATIPNWTYPYWNLAGLQPSTQYYVRVRTVDATGTSVNSPVLGVTTLAHPGQISSNLWANNFGATDNEWITSIANDPWGNVYVTGVAQGAAFTIGSFTLNPLGGADMFIAKFNSSGVAQWAHRIGSSLDDEGWHVVADAHGVYLSGTFSGTVDFDPNGGTANLIANANTGHPQWTYLDDGFIAKYNLSDGSLAWAKSLGNAWTNWRSGKSLFIDDDGQGLVVTGTFVGTNDFDPNGGTWNLTSAGGSDIFLAKYDRWNGSINWAQRLGGAFDEEAMSVTGDFFNLYLAGSHKGDIDLNPTAVTQAVTGYGSFISSFSKGGAFRWAKSYQNNDPTSGDNTYNTATYYGVAILDLALDNDNIYAVGNFSSVVDFDPNGGTALRYGGATTGFATKLTKLGDHVWSGNTYAYGGDGLSPHRVLVDAAGIYVAGTSNWSVDFDGGPDEAVRTSLSQDIFLARYNSADGGFQWAKTMGSWADEGTRAVALTNDGLYLAGGFSNNMNFDPYLGSVYRAGAGGSDAFIAKYESTSPPPPPVPTQLTPAFISNTGFNNVWYAVPGVQEYRIDVSTDNFSSFTILDGELLGLSAGVNSNYWTNLQPSTTYNIRVASVSPGGIRSAYSNVETFTTAPHPAQTAPNLWTTTVGSTGADEVTGVALDASGNVYTTGIIRGDVTLGATTLVHGGNGDVFFAMYNSSGTVQWAKSLSSTFEEAGTSIAVDATGVYVLGYHWGPANLDFDPGIGVQLITAEGTTYNAFVAKYSLVDGAFIWAKPLNDSRNATGKSIQSDGTGVYVTGAFIGTNDFQPGAGSTTRTPVGAEDAYLARYAAIDGSLVWVTSFGSTLNDFGYSVLLDGSFVYTSGYMLGSGDLDPGAGTANAPVGAYVSKFNIADGSLVWATPIEGAEYAFDLDKNATDLFVAGSFQGTVDFDPAGTFIMESARTSGYVARYALADGTFVSASLIRASSTFFARRIVVDNSGYYLGGNGVAGIDFDPGIGEDNRHATYNDALLARYTTEGELVWAKAIGSYFDDTIRGGLALGPDGLYIGGYFGGTVNFDPYLNVSDVVSAGSIDGFLAKYQIEVSAPGAPTANAATDVTASGFTANWSSAATAASYRLDVSTSNTFANFLPGYQNLTVSQLSKVLTGLDPNTTYYYQVRAVNNAGVSGNSNMVTVTTTAPALTAPVANAANTISATAFMSSWNSVATATGYQLDVSADDFVTYVPGYHNRSVGSTSEGVIGLNAQVQYKYRVRAVGSGGTSENSNVISVTTPEYPPLAPLATAASLITATSFTANWDAAAGATGYKLDVSSDNFITFVAGYNGKVLVGNSDALSGLIPHKSYQYRVRATNAGGASINSNVIVAVTAFLPQPPQANPAASITISSFTANWNAVGDATSYRLDVSADNFVNFVAGFNDKTIAGTTDAVTGLTPSTNYKYRVRAVNGNGTSMNSSIIDVTTLALPNPPTATAATSVTASAFTANWTSVGSATSYRLDISSDDFATNLAAYNDKTIAGTSEIVTGLTPSTTYKYRVRAVDPNGTSVNSNTQTVATMPLPVAPVATAATAITFSSFTANWNAVGGATSYRLDVSSDNFVNLVAGYSDLTVATTSSPVTGLALNTAYKYRVRAVNANGTSVNSNIIDVTTLDGVVAPVAAAGSSITAGGFTANWAAVSGATGYQLDVSLNNFASFVPGFFNKAVSGTSAPVTGLAPETDYQYRVRAVDGNGPSDNSNVITVTTLAIPVPVAIAASFITSTSFAANWNASSGAFAYRLDVSADNFATMVVGYNDKSVGGITDAVSGLTPGGSYQYRVRAVTSFGVSGNSNTVSVTVNSLPSAPIANAATNVGITGFTANWSAVPNVNSYQLDISGDNFTTFVTGYNGKSLSAVVTSEVVTGLSAGTAYKYRVRSVNVDGVSLNSNTTDVTTQSKQNQTIVFAGLTERTFGGAAFQVSAASTSGLGVVFTPVTDHTTISGDMVTIVKAGKAKIRASQPGDDTFNAAADVDREFCINPVAPVLTMSNAGTATPTLTSNASTGTHQWFRDGAVVGGESSATLQVTVQGVYTAKVIIDGCTSAASANFAVIVTGDIAPGARDLSIAPNPADDEILIQLPGSGRREVSILQANGTMVHSHATDRDEATINVRSYSGGLYIVKVVSSTGSFYGRFIKK